MKYTLKHLEKVVTYFEGNVLFEAQNYRQSPKTATLAQKRDAFRKDIEWVREHVSNMASKAERESSEYFDEKGQS